MTDQKPACIHPDGYDGECPCPADCVCCPVAARTTPDSTALREQYAALAFNAVAPALKAHDHWLPLTVRQAVAAAVLAVRDRQFAALKRAHVALAAQAGRDQAALKRLRTRVQAVADEARGSVRDWLIDALADLDDPRQPSTAADTCADGCRGVTGIRGLLEHVGIDTSGRNINVAGKVVDVAPDGGPTVAEAADDDKRWPLEKEGE